MRQISISSNKYLYSSSLACIQRIPTYHSIFLRLIQARHVYDIVVFKQRGQRVEKCGGHERMTLTDH